MKNLRSPKMSLSPSIKWPETWLIVTIINVNDKRRAIISTICVGILRAVLEAAVEGALVLDLCVLGDRLILEETSKVYKKEKELKKGALVFE